MKKLICAIALVATPLAAEDFSAGSEAKSWNLYAEEPATFAATVVDITCEITGDCADNCGDGKRQLGLLREVDDVLVYPNKNSQSSFNGAGADLLPYCGQKVEVDGLLIEDEDLAVENVYLVQKIRVAGAAEWSKANQWTKVWKENHPESDGKGPWFRRDPRVLAAIAENGHLGLGLEIDETFKKELFE